MQPPPMSKASIPGVSQIIAVASGKGGVGKSTVAANLALALHQAGQRVGLMDADIYGPSVPIMFGLGTVDQEKTPFPVERYGIKLMSMGFLVDPNQAVIWRGPKVAQAVSAFLTQIPWGQLDYLIIDMPPGTGDAQLTLTQTVALTGAVIVTTPQDVALIDARKGLRMFNEVRVPIVGIIENMSYFIGADGQRYELFRSGGGQKLAQEASVPFLGALPIDPRVAECGDLGEPIVARYSDAPVGQAYRTLADTVVQTVGQTRPTALPQVEL
jgi:ATP-binding protein involved in chromosome partitioning